MNEPLPPSLTEIPGVALRRLEQHRDARGSLMEVWRAAWPEGVAAQQVTLLHCAPNSLRGVHVHHRHADFLCVVAGRMQIGLKDLRGPGGRPWKQGKSAMLTLDAEMPTGLRIPPGVAHGLLAPVAATMLLAVDRGWDPVDDLGCRFDDPGLGLSWPCRDPILSARDREAGDLDALLRDYAGALARCA